MGKMIYNYGKINCCHGCSDRGIKEIDGKEVRCHSICEKYLGERARVDEENAILNGLKVKDNDTYAHVTPRFK